MDRWAQDLRIALRGLRRTPAFTGTVVVILAIGIGMSVAMFTVFHAVLIQRLPIRDQDHVVALWTVRDDNAEFGGTPQALAALRRESRTLLDIAGIVHWGATAYPLVDGDRSIVINQGIVETNFFDVLGARPVLGRFLRREDADGGKFQPASYKSAEHAIVVSYATWQKYFGGDPAVIGRHLFDPYAEWFYTIVGVAPAGLDYPAGVEYWVPMGKDAELDMIAVARLMPRASPAAAGSEYLAVVQRVMNELGSKAHLTGAIARTLPQQMLGGVRPAIEILTAAVGLLLFIACVDVANLLLLRAASRGREIAIRRAIGANSSDVVRQLIVESGVLAIGGGLLGFVCAQVLLRVLVTLAPAQLPRTDVIRLTGAPVVLALLTTAAAVVFFGVVPALLAARTDVGSPLRTDARSGGESKGRRRLREMLVASQVALALVMVMGAGLLAHSLARLQEINLGFTADHLSFFTISMPAAAIDSQPRAFALGDELLPRLRTIPGVTAVTPVMIPPLLGPNVMAWRFEAEGRSPSEGDAMPMIPVDGGGPDLFRVLGVPIVRGHGFSAPDGPGAPEEAVVTETVARQFWPGQDPIGKMLRAGAGDSGWRAVVGVVPDLHIRSLKEPTPMVFLRWRQSFWQGWLAVRTTGTLASVLPAIRDAVSEVDPESKVLMPETMDDYLAAPLAGPRLNALLLSGFGLVALVLSAFGLYGVMASAVRQQTREIGVRLALGATSGRVRRDVLMVALGIAAAGTLAGIFVALVSSKLLSALLFEVSPTDPLTLWGACAVLLSVSAAAAYLPARRATRIDPAEALRAE
jgi:putative ABC transport system permease protein